MKYLQSEWALDGIEVKSVGDTSVTVSTPIYFDLSKFVLSIDDMFGAECDFSRENNDVEIQIYVPTANHRQKSDTKDTNEISMIILCFIVSCVGAFVLHRMKHIINIPNITSSM